MEGSRRDPGARTAVKTVPSISYLHTLARSEALHPLLSEWESILDKGGTPKTFARVFLQSLCRTEEPPAPPGRQEVAWAFARALMDEPWERVLLALPESRRGRPGLGFLSEKAIAFYENFRRELLHQVENYVKGLKTGSGRSKTTHQAKLAVVHFGVFLQAKARKKG